jgi:hypothetical protein
LCLVGGVYYHLEQFELALEHFKQAMILRERVRRTLLLESVLPVAFPA